MRPASMPPLQGKSADDWQKPVNALEPLIPYLKRNWTIWVRLDDVENDYKYSSDNYQAVAISDSAHILSTWESTKTGGML
jgi:hypothetical protein